MTLHDYLNEDDVAKAAAERRKLNKDYNHHKLNREQITEQAVQVFELRLTGASTVQIAEALHMSKATVVKRLKQHEQAYLLPLTDSVRKMEVARYDSYLLRLQTRIAEGDTTAIATALRISEARRRLLGADAPSPTQEVNVTVQSQLDSNISKLLSEMADQVEEQDTVLYDPTVEQ